MSTDSTFPAFDPSMFEQEQKKENKKVTWTPNRKAIEKALGEDYKRYV